ncbi:MAG: hypothetical protein H6Q71_1729 [Firmicutes bacterium]|nr:hypothetical protein [Bacillota bacterium]
MGECKHLWKKYLGFADRPATERQYCAKCGMDKETWLEQNLQQAEKTIADMLMSTKPLEEYERLQRDNKALRCCGNCINEFKRCDAGECFKNGYSHWVIDGKLVNKGE